MNEYSIALLWSLIQITLCCLLSLCVVWSLRGRRPQLAAGLLSGTCVACVLLLLATAFPRQHWSLREAFVGWQGKGAGEAGRGWQVADSIGEDAVQPADSSETLIDSSSGDVLPAGSLGTQVSPTLGLPRAGWAWLNVRWLHLDEQIRRASQTPAVQERFGMLTVASTAIMLAVFGLWLVGWFHARRIARHCTPIDSEEMRNTCRKLMRQLGCKREPTIFASSRIAVGATMGWRRPIVVLSCQYRDWQAEQLAAVLAHELAHAARRDYAWVLVSSLARVLLWFHPLMHLVVRRLRLEQELAADQIAASALGARAYGRALAQLALANQIPLRTPSPMLAASQICVTRRISMLQQGRLKPKFLQPRWAGGLTLLAIATALPLSGLRGQTGTPPTEESETTVQVTTEPSPDGPAAAGREEQLAALRKFPPLRVEGTMVYRHAKMASSTQNRGYAWVSRFLQIAFVGRPLSSDCVLYGEASIISKWRDLSKEHGSLQTDATIRSADNNLPGELSRFLSAPALSHLIPMDKSQTVAGRTAIAFTGRGDAEGETLCWVVDDDQGFHRGKTIEELLADMTREIVPPTIPAIYQADYDVAAAAVVFADCTNLLQEFKAFIEGSEKQELLIVPQMIDGLESLGVFLVQGGSKLKVRAKFVDEQVAVRVRALITGMISGLQAAEASADDPVLRRLAAVDIQRDGSELTLRTDGEFYSEAVAAELLNDPIVDGWLAPMTSAGHTEDGVALRGGGLGLIPKLVQQSVDAAAYRGRRLKVTAEMNCSQGFEGYTGLAAWASDVNDWPIVSASRAGDGQADLAAVFAEGHVDKDVPDDVTQSGWRETTIELDVPQDASSLSLAIYSQHANAEVRKLTITDVGPASSLRQECPDFYSVFNVPGRPILAEPTNLDFETSMQTGSATRVAELEGQVDTK